MRSCAANSFVNDIICSPEIPKGFTIQNVNTILGPGNLPLRTESVWKTKGIRGIW